MKKLVLLLLIIFTLTPKDTTHNVYIPLAYKVELKVGVESEESWKSTVKWLNRARPLKVSCQASEVVQSDGSYNWATCDNKADSLDIYLLVIKTTPEEWLLPNQPICKLPQEEYWDEYANLVQEVINRYHPVQIGLWNEPDSLDSSYPQLYGCVGDGRLYGRFVKYIYNHIEGSRVGIGEVSNIQSKFVTDMLSTNQGNYDVLTFHCYAGFYYWYGLYNGCIEKLDYAKNLTNKEVMLDETSVYPKDIDPTNKEHIRLFEDAQVEYWGWLVSLDRVTFWYTICNNGWPEIIPGGGDLCNRLVYNEYIK